MSDRGLSLVKRFVDLIITIPALIILAPSLLLISLLVYLKLGTPVLFGF